MPPVAVSICELPGQMPALAGLIVPVGDDDAVITDAFDAGPLHIPLVIITL